MFASLFRNVSGEEKEDAIERIIEHASPRQDFFLMITLAVAMAAMGVITESTIVLIGSMLIAPILFPLLSFSLGIVLADTPILGRSLYTLVKSTVLAIIASAVIGVFFTETDLGTIGIIAGSVPTLAYAFVAGIAGFAAAFAMTKENLNETLPGVAISVALVPPLAVAGIGLAHLEWGIFVDAFLLYLTNIAGVVLFSSVAFSLFGFASKRRAAEKAVKADEKEIRKEETAAPNPA